MSKLPEAIDAYEKQPLTDEFPPEERPRSTRLIDHLLYRALPLILVLFGLRHVYHQYVHPMCANPRHPIYTRPFTFDDQLVPAANVSKVRLEAHIMSKCPDAADCLQKLIVPAMAQVGSQVDFRLSYIGSIDSESDDVHCMHGPGECLGNIIQLCAQQMYADPKQYLGFANCMTSDYSKIPDRELVEGCALEYGIDFKQINNCISQEGKGTELLRKSIRRSKDNNVTTSCTVRLEDKVRCVRDGGKWSNCPGGSSVADLVHDIQHLYNEKNPEDSAPENCKVYTAGGVVACSDKMNTPGDYLLQDYKMQLMLLEQANRERLRKLREKEGGNSHRDERRKKLSRILSQNWELAAEEQETV